MKKSFIVDCFGDFSNDQDWDEGMVSFVVKKMDEDSSEELEMINYKECCYKEHNKYMLRNVTLIVNADSAEKAVNKARDWCEEHYPRRNYYVEED